MGTFKPGSFVALGPYHRVTATDPHLPFSRTKRPLVVSAASALESGKAARDTQDVSQIL